MRKSASMDLCSIEVDKTTVYKRAQSNPEQTVNGFRPSLMIDCSSSRPTGTRARGRSSRGHKSIDLMPKRSIASRTNRARVHFTLLSAEARMKLGCRCWRKRTPRHTAISTLFKEASPGKSKSGMAAALMLIPYSEAIEDLTGGVTTELFTSDILDTDKFWTDEIMKVNKEFLFGCATGVFDTWQTGWSFADRKDIVSMHAYS